MEGVGERDKLGVRALGIVEKSEAWIVAVQFISTCTGEGQQIKPDR